MVEMHVPYVVTVLRDMAPVAMVEIERDSPSSAQTSVHHPDEARLPEIIEALEMAYHACQFLHWKLTGEVPRPLGMDGPEEQAELPF